MYDGTQEVSFTYDANGMRKTKTAGATTFTYTYNGSQLTQMTRGTDVLHFYYDASGIPVAFRYNNTTYFYVTTLQGDVLLILDEDGEIVVSYDYDAWGKILAIGGSMATTLGTLNPLTYRGYVYDHETGLYYLQSRYYNPEWGRFLNADALISTGGLLGNNMFAYCGNNPVSREDPTGHSYCKVYFDSFSPFDTGLVNVAGCAGGGSGFVGGNCVTTSVNGTEPSQPKRTGTTTRGFSFSATFIVGVCLDIGITYDKKGNIGFLFSYSIVSGSPSIGVSKFVTKTNAPDIYAQEGPGVATGGSASVMGTIASVGLETSVIMDKDDLSAKYVGQTLSGGLGFGPPGEYHASTGNTNVVGFNIWDVLSAITR